MKFKYTSNVLDSEPLIKDAKDIANDPNDNRIEYNGNSLSINDPYIARQILNTQASEITKQMSGPLIGFHSMAITDGVDHDQVKEIFREVMAFNVNPEFKDRVGFISSLKAQEMVKAWIENPSMKIDLFDEMQNFAIEVTFKTLFPEALEGDTSVMDRAKKAISTMMHAQDRLYDVFNNSNLKSIVTAIKHLPALISSAMNHSKSSEDVINKGEQFVKKDSESLLHHIIQQVQQQKLDRQVAIDQIKTLLIAGDETTASSLTWTIIEILKLNNIDLERSIANETKEINQKPITRAVFEEAMRKTTIVEGIFRSIPETIVNIKDKEGRVIERIKIGPNKNVKINAHAIAHNPNYYKDPHTFNPNRFLGKNRENPFTYLAFGGGSHMCLGVDMAGEVLETAISTLFFELGKNGFRLHLDTLDIGIYPGPAARKPDKQVIARLVKIEG